MALITGLRTGLESGLRVGINATGLASFASDAASGKPVPASAQEWTNFRTANGLAIANPSYLHLCQESSGNLADSIGSLTLTANASPLYQQTVSGWSRKAVGTAVAGGVAQRFSNPSGPDVSTTSVALFCYVHFPGADINVKVIGALGANDNVSIYHFLTAGKSVLRLRGGGQIVNGTVDHDADVNGTTAMMLVLRRDIDSVDEMVLYTQHEKIIAGVNPTTPASATAYTIGAHAGSPQEARYLYSCGWSGVNAQITSAQVKAFFQALGYAPSWS